MSRSVMFLSRGVMFTSRGVMFMSRAGPERDACVALAPQAADMWQRWAPSTEAANKVLLSSLQRGGADRATFHRVLHALANSQPAGERPRSSSQGTPEGSRVPRRIYRGHPGAYPGYSRAEPGYPGAYPGHSGVDPGGTPPRIPGTPPRIQGTPERIQGTPARIQGTLAHALRATCPRAPSESARASRGHQRRTVI
eukprot:417962-Prorocentrum_minimum.AAC.1